MPANGAAPGELASKLRGDARLDGNASNLSQLGLPPHVVACLEAENIRTLEDWHKLGRRRQRSIFGITSQTALLLSRAARETLT